MFFTFCVAAISWENLGSWCESVANQALFSKCGEVLEAKIVRNHRDGRSLGFGFITYTSDESAHAAIMSLTGYEIRGTSLERWAAFVGAFPLSF